MCKDSAAGKFTPKKYLNGMFIQITMPFGG
jgi:hypothetical protein